MSWSFINVRISVYAYKGKTQSSEIRMEFGLYSFSSLTWNLCESHIEQGITYPLGFSYGCQVMKQNFEWVEVKLKLWNVWNCPFIVYFKTYWTSSSGSGAWASFHPAFFIFCKLSQFLPHFSLASQCDASESRDTMGCQVSMFPNVFSLILPQNSTFSVPDYPCRGTY